MKPQIAANKGATVIGSPQLLEQLENTMGPAGAPERPRLLAMLRLWTRRWRQRRHMRRELTELSESELRDLGLTFSEAKAIAATPFWRDERVLPAKSPRRG